MKTFHQWWNTFFMDDGLGWWEAVLLLMLGIFLLAVLGQGSLFALIGVVIFGVMLAGLVVRAVTAWWRDPINLYDLF